MTDEAIEKAESSAKVAVPGREIGQPRIVTGSNWILDQRQSDLKMPTRLTTFDNMYEDDAVFNSIDVTNLLVTTALFGGKFVPGESGSNSSQIAADFLNYCIRNMSYGTWLEFLQNAVTDLKYGFSIQNIVVEKRNYGPYKGSYVLRKLSPRDQKSMYGWLWNKNQTELLGVVQKPRLIQTRQYQNVGWKDGLTALSAGKFYETDYPIIKTNQMLHFKYNTTNNNPQGDSPLMHCYNAWMEKRLVEEYEVIGVSKDLGGIVVLRVPSDLISRANDPASFPTEATEYTNLQQDTADLHAGKSNFIVLTSDADEVTKKYFYDFELKGIEGQGKQYKTSEIITQKRKSIYNVFGTSQILLGEDSVGSFSLSNDKSSLFSYYIERAILQKLDVLNNQLAPRLLSLNNIYLDWKDVPVFENIDPTETDQDELSKVVQRVGSVNKLTPEALKLVYKQLGWPDDGIDELDFTDKGQSRAGEGQGTSGTGSIGTGVSTSTANVSNSDVSKTLIQDGKYIVDAETGDPINQETNKFNK